MPEYRQDPVSGNWVIIARERADRPTEFAVQSTHRRTDPCPFCSGNEQFTPRPVALYPPAEDAASAKRWQVRVISNKFPALVEGASAGDPSPMLDPDAIFSVLPGYGVHEVIVESPQHSTSFCQLSAQQAFWSFVAYRDRLRCLTTRPGIRFGLIFKNCRGAGGATLEHTHSQLLATVMVPPVLEREFRAAHSHFQCHQGCLFCRLLAGELASGKRIVATSERFIAFCPFASRFPYETWVLPRRHEADFQKTKLDELEELSQIFQKILRALEKILPQVPHNYWIHTSPFDTSPYDYYHWHIELISRIGTQAGFEWGSGCFVNSVAPEDAATALREAAS